MCFVRPILILALTLSSHRALAQGAGQGPTWEQATTRQWKALHDKILVMAKDAQLPDARLETRPHPDARTLMDELRHVTIGLEMSTAELLGQPFDYAAREKADEAKPRTRALMIREMEAAIAASYPAVEKGASPRLVMWVEHQAEHYGKLVSGYRLAGVVPPTSRPRRITPDR
ncbi:MAG: hypothetical protein JNJ98_02325 [Gemmatimonadetes bacterium]|nr:hypothetical protein [Gemmatimonadota bacterium]